jgi:2-hydroxychromene-2-carboxylate isomerase
MKRITFYLDFVSPFAYLAFETLPRVLEGLSYSVDYQPVLLGGLVKHFGQLAPAEIPPKRDWTYRHVLWLAQQAGVPLQMPAAHPFNPLPLLRLALALASGGRPNRFICETIFRHVWHGGYDANDAQRMHALRGALGVPDDLAADGKQALQRATEAAIHQGVFGVPAFVVDEKLFWGLDALPMLRGYLAGDAFGGGDDWDAVWQSVQSVPSAILLRTK